jgi:tetratricopeptide (TPR) repeat protein
MKLNTLRLMTLVLGVAILVSCSRVKKATSKYEQGTKYATEPEMLEVRGDSVEYALSITVEPKAMDKKATVMVNPSLDFGDKSTELDQIVLEGTKPRRGKTPGAKEITSEGDKIIVRNKFKFEEGMEKAQLVAKPKVMVKGYDEVQDQCIACKKRVFSKGISTTGLLLTGANPAEDILESKFTYSPIRKDTKIEIYYLVNSSTFNPNFKVSKVGIDNQVQIKKLKELAKDTSLSIKGIEINGTASPDGELMTNEKLSQERAKSTFQFFKKELKKLGFDEVNDSAFSLNYSMTEDWEGWRKLVEASSLSDKDAILAIMNSRMDNSAKEMQIKRDHAKSYNMMKEEMLPLLRRAIITFNRQEPLKTNDEILAIGLNDMKALEASELMQLGHLMSKPEDKIKVYSLYTSLYPNDWKGHNDLAMAYLKMGDSKKALPSLNKAASLTSDVEEKALVNNNLGVAYAIEKDYTKSVEFYSNAAKAGVSQDQNMALLKMRQGDFEGAVTSIKNKCSINSALAYTMTKDYNSANNAMNCIKSEDKDAKYFYLGAVIGARTDNLANITTNLTRAVQMNPEMRERAKNDIEFSKYFDRVEFQNAIK